MGNSEWGQSANSIQKRLAFISDVVTTDLGRAGRFPAFREDERSTDDPPRYTWGSDNIDSPESFK